jgi:hypothetical protein
MASVRMTRDLRQRILQNAFEAFDNARPQPFPNTEITNLLRDAILRSPPYMFLHNLHNKPPGATFASFGGPPKTATNRDEVTNINFSTQTGFRGLSPTRHSNIIFTFVPSIVIYRTERWGTPEVRFEELTPEDQTTIGPKCAELVKEIQEYMTERETYRTKLSGLLERCTSVKQLLLAWPGGESFIPDAAKQRMYVTVTRKEVVNKIKEDIKFDDSFVNQVVLTSKIVGA